MNLDVKHPEVIRATSRRAIAARSIDPLDAVRQQGYLFTGRDGECWQLTEAPNGETFVTRVRNGQISAFVIDEDFGSLTGESAGLVVALWRKTLNRAEALRS